MSTPSHQRLQLQRGNGVPEGLSGVATIWLLSTLGASRNANTVRVKKKDILSVSIPKTCEALLQSSTDYTLRSASSLLYGVAVCYGRKTDYVLADVNSVKAQLQRQLLEGTRKRTALFSRNFCPTTIFDGTKEYRNLLEFQTTHSSVPFGRRDPFLTDDPTFDINQIGDISFLDAERRGLNQSASLIHQRDMLDELQNGYNHETGPGLGRALAENRPYNRGSLETVELSALDANLHIDFDDVLSEIEMGSVQSRSGGNNELSDQEDFQLNFEGGKPLGIPNIDSLPDLGIQSLKNGDDEHHRQGKRPFSSSKNAGLPNESDGQSKKPKTQLPPDCLLKVKFDDKIGMANDDLRENSGSYCAIMDSYTSNLNCSAKTRPDSNKLMAVIFDDDSPTFLRLCFETLLLAQEDSSALANTASSSPAIERGRRRRRSIASSRSSSSIMSTERGRRVGPSDEIEIGGDKNDSILLPELHQIDENVEVDDFYDELDGTGQDVMRIDLQLPPSSFGRSSSRTDAGSKDQIEELQRLNADRRTRRQNPFGSVQDMGQSSYSSFSVEGVAREGFHHQVLDNQSRRLFEYILERVSFIGSVARSHPPFGKKLFLEDLIPSMLTMEVVTDSNERLRPVSRKLAANAFLCILQLASKSYVDLASSGVPTGFESLDGNSIVIYV
ncbi:LADA_0F06458g1_1 [Lachancea dasiensis]|uniref:LADA_0F06458g1_1 n=1 Tax=Lachancea dasiensis TaxID=1072105 RepID=A0A1G4JK12_9SACH|nr:LADA_0F06458g1_1 [Lachancea dasiensis]